MRAAVYRGPGRLQIENVPEPGPPAPGELVLDVLRAAICGTDSSEWKHGPMLTRPPVTLGHEFVGRVAAVGEGVEEFVVGDRVVSGAGISCGTCEWCRAGRTNLCARYYTLGLQRNGGLADQAATPAAVCRAVPEAVNDDAAAMAQPLSVALHAVRRSGVGRGDACAVIGVGGIGAFIVAGAVDAGASPVIAVDVEGDRLATARRLGATALVDARSTDATAAIAELTGGEGAHVVIESSGAPQGPATALAATRRGGRALIVGLQAAPRELDLLDAAVREVEIGTTVAHVCAVDLPESLELLARTPLAAVVLDRVIPLDTLVDEGIRPLAEGTARGKIVVDTRPT